jgi:hypothetical protein
VLVRNLVRKGNFKVEASGIRVGRRSRGNDEFNPFERALDKLGISCRAFPIQVPRCVCLCMYTKHIRTHTHTHIHTYMCVCVCVCVCTGTGIGLAADTGGEHGLSHVRRGFDSAGVGRD